MAGPSSNADAAAATAAAAGAPARKALAPKDKKRWTKLLGDTNKLEQLKEDSEASRFFDHSSPSSRKARARTRARFEEFVEAVFDVTEIPEIWNSWTIIDRTKRFLGGLAATSNGLFNTKIKASSLWLAKHCIYWWAVRFIPDFSAVYHDWHARTVEHVHYICIKEGLSTEYHEKHNLTDTELAMFYQHVMKLQYGVDNSKQHFVAMMLAWTTAARPGTFTVPAGYEQGAETGVPGVVRKESQTLYWRDVVFQRLEDGTIAARVKFRFHKGYRDPHSQETLVDSSRTFTFIPTMGSRFEFDLSLLLLGLAWNRGLFSSYPSLEDLINGEDVFLKLDEQVKGQAVFVSATRSGGIDPTKPMRSGALNPKLQDWCIEIGLFARNTYYSFRRTAIVETRRRDGSEAARDLAFHKPGTDSLFSYDDIGFGDVDMTAYRLGLDKQKMDRDDIRKYFSQASSLYNPELSTGLNLRKTLKARIDEEKAQDPQWIEVELGTATIYEGLIEKLEALKQDGLINADATIPSMYASKAFSAFQDLAAKYGLEEHLAEDFIQLEAHLSHRKTVQKSVRNRLTKEIKKKIEAEQKKLTTTAKTKSQRLLPGKGFEPPGIARGIDKINFDQATSGAAAELDAAETHVLIEDEEDSPLDPEFLDRHEDEVGGRGEPSSWRGLNADVEIRVDRDDEEDQADDDDAANPKIQEVDITARNNFLLAWARKADSSVPNSNLSCHLCLADDTIPAKAKETKYSLAKLNIHLGTATHSRRSQILRAFKIEAETVKASQIRCPICGLGNTGRGSASSKFIDHIEEQHPGELWESDEDEQDDSMNPEGAEIEEEDTFVSRDDGGAFEAGLEEL